MSYGGASMAATSGSTSASTIGRVNLEKENELRIEVNNETPLKLRLLNGQAEIFGSELAPGRWLTFPPRHRFAVFTWYGATIEMDGVAESYTADETPMISYVNVHAVLDKRRKYAKASSSNASEASQGPRVIVVGPPDCGKSTLSKMLLSWAARLGWKPIFVDLDVSEGAITVPGCIAAKPIEMPIDPVEGIPFEMSIVYFYGHTSLGHNVALYNSLMIELAQKLEAKLAHNAESRAAGVVINTVGWIEGAGYAMLLHAIDTFKANVVLVLDQDKLFSLLKSVAKSTPNLDVVKLHKSGGVVSRNPEFRRKARSCRIREYFYGLANNLFPHSYFANFRDLHIYRIDGPQAPRSALPLGAEAVANPLRLTPVNIDLCLIQTVLAVSYANTPDQIVSSNVAGFIHIVDINILRQEITYLSPSRGELPSKYLIMGTLAWIDT